MTDIAKKNYIEAQLYKAAPLSPERCESRGPASAKLLKKDNVTL